MISISIKINKLYKQTKVQTMLTRKYYNMLAEVFREAYEKGSNLKQTIYLLEESLQKDNPGFKSSRFQKAIFDKKG
jgi:hypothetical protein